ncbi:LysR family transcriptional regulator [Pseudobacter ginsenosidimutans]|uniref:DNA-binding transcriptional LysR family regulator n=1 Tax=Pseudobacter ginsenosidimutans TaxID=661488 RepID=A0A4Q7MQQ3_9BACT|nr:LysR family transcriptional regulator [Pseudobacter ginsenosidimutans]QEC42450.1 LysR family transcriptional regulator [Pseudobacter ginsenosidimutans]RZS70698.1 DNA-binding transcriptional LysR family regulator [Pseudobacter ginsenosidimutans]
MFDFRLKVFHTVASRLNFTKAAEELFITQPAVTKHIHEIEQHFKVKLFERDGRKVQLTAAGQTLLKYTTELFALYRNLEFEMNTQADKKAGRLRVGASTTVAQYVLPPVLASFHKKFPEIRITLSTDNTEQIEQALQQRQVDIGIIEGRSKNSAFRYTPFLKDELVLVANAGHPLAKKGIIRPEDLPKIPLLLREPGSGTLEVIAHALRPLGIKTAQLKKEMQLSSTESIKGYLQHSHCMAFLSIHSILSELEQRLFTVIEVKGLSIQRDFFLISPHGESGALVNLFMQFALTHNFR